MPPIPLMPRYAQPALAAVALVAVTVAGPATAGGEVPVVASVKPVHSLVSAVMAGVGEPHLMMRGAASHHGFDMRPSDAAKLQEAEIVFLIDEAMESGLAAAIDTLAPGARVIELTAAEGLVRRPLREGGTFEADPFHEHDGDDDHGHDHAHSHDDEDDDDHDHAHKHGHDHDHDHEDGHGHAHGHGDGDDDDHGHGHERAKGPFDLHVWLDPVNAEAMAHMIADTLSQADSANAAKYEDNAHELIHRLEDLTAEIAADLTQLADRPFIVFHDGYRYFEDRFGLAAAGSAVVSPEHTPGVRRIRELREKVRELGVVCVIDEPAFDRRLVNTVIEGSSVRAGTVDPMGAVIDAGPELYFTLLRNMAGAFKGCLAPGG